MKNVEVFTLYKKEMRTLKREDICICITDLLCCTPETNTRLYSNYTPIKNFFKKMVDVRKAPSNFPRAKKLYPWTISRNLF